MPLAPVYKVEHAFARLGRWRRLSRCYEGTGASALAWHQVVCVVYLFVPLRAEPKLAFPIGPWEAAPAD
jgi:hypothetical protein